MEKRGYIVCGFAGVFHLDGTVPDREMLGCFSRLLAHRGPDGAGEMVDGPLGLAHRRLSILDLSDAAHQPMWDEEQRACLAYNGEIYNFQEIRDELRAAGWSFRSSGDTEVLLKACLHFGVPEALSRLNGMFGLAFWDGKARRLWLARDRMGIKPLYYAERGGRLVFGSEIKPILEVLPATPDVVTLLDVLAGEPPTWGYHTLFEGVAAIEPGEWLCIDAMGHRQSGRYFRLFDQVDRDRYAEADAASAETMTGALRELLERSVRLHLVSDAPVGVLASGGLDSNLIAALTRPSGVDVDLYHAEVAGPQSERWAAERLGEYLERPIQYATLSPQEYIETLAQVAYHHECPSGYHPNDVPFYLVSRKAAQDGVKVLLTGEGADELFFGYESMVLGMGRRSFVRAGDRARSVLRRLPGGRQLMSLLPRGDELPAQLLRRGYEQALREEAREVCSFIPEVEDREVLVESLVSCSAHLESLLIRNDRMGMMAGLESRIPFLENELVRFAVNLPRRFKAPRHPLALGYRHPMRENKWLLRQVGRQLLPAELHSRKKCGFPVAPWRYLDLRTEFFRQGFLLDTLKTPFANWETTWDAASDDFRWTAFATEIWGRLFFHRDSPAEVTQMLLPFTACGESALAA